jgi:hypothetical protein
MTLSRLVQIRRQSTLCLNTELQLELVQNLHFYIRIEVPSFSRVVGIDIPQIKIRRRPIHFRIIRLDLKIKQINMLLSYTYNIRTVISDLKRGLNALV